jgi:hypothetical protein
MSNTREQEEARYQKLQAETVDHAMWPECRCIKCNWCEDYRVRKAVRFHAAFVRRPNDYEPGFNYDPEL